MIDKMKRLAIILALLFPLCLVAQQKGFKLVEKSEKSKPKWTSSAKTPGYIFKVIKEAATLDDAESMAKTYLLSEIASSVAVRITQETTNDVDWTVSEEKGKVSHDQYVESVKSKTVTKVAKMPAIQGISIAKAKIYWERYYNKKTKIEYYDYYMMYPFSNLDLIELTEAYNAQEKAIDDKIQSLENGLTDIQSVEDIDNAVYELNALIKQLDSDDNRMYDIQSIVSKYKKIYESIELEVLSNTKESIVFQLNYNGKQITTAQLPKVKSNCADKIMPKNLGDRFEISFDCFNCYKQDNNYLEIQFRFGNKIFKQQVFFNI